ncbi:Ca2+-binding EF-hand superfamily protein [Allocatelliglobosispora scoriae]|uniref:Ca2+-binding EF-hand superfamily protein n=1 Tax=Allocatelliglobosispora scoriae TaxID=643052 RepID=A0A841C568_9ACTN|nr:hypothetical protein [Allocatelliglobosispora scoriae]MBB5873961.1 Ca2+-binding EF-hand superfamily protein [Allocatelliglobosispora scoriae]
MGLNDYQAKMSDRFSTFDHDRDGLIISADVAAMARSILDTYAVPAHSPKATDLLDGAHRLFIGLAQETDEDHNGGISRTEFIAGASRRMLNNSLGFTAIVRPWARSVIAIADTDGDGRVSPDEWSRMLRAMGCTPQGAAGELRHLVPAQGGPIHVDAALHSAVVFYTSDQPRNPYA